MVTSFPLCREPLGLEDVRGNAARADDRYSDAVGLEFVREDEGVEVTPGAVRLRKNVLSAHQRGKIVARAR